MSFNLTYDQLMEAEKNAKNMSNEELRKVIKEKVPDVATCYNAKSEKVPNCKCHEDCISCGFNEYPDKKNNCIACYPGYTKTGNPNEPGECVKDFCFSKGNCMPYYQFLKQLIIGILIFIVSIGLLIFAFSI